MRAIKAALQSLSLKRYTLSLNSITSIGTPTVRP